MEIQHNFSASEMAAIRALYSLGQTQQKCGAEVVFRAALQVSEYLSLQQPQRLIQYAASYHR